jgi:hypothetical protein
MARTSKSALDTQILSAAIHFMELEKQRIDAQIDQVRALLGRRGWPAGKVTRKRRLSAAARKRMALAQKRRWAEYRKRKTAKVR